MAAEWVEGKVRESQEGHSGVSFKIQVRYERELKTSCWVVVTPPMSRLGEFSSWRALRTQPFGAITIHIDYKLPTARIKEGGACQVLGGANASYFTIWWYTPRWETLGEKRKKRKESRMCWEAGNWSSSIPWWNSDRGTLATGIQALLLSTSSLMELGCLWSTPGKGESAIHRCHLVSQVHTGEEEETGNTGKGRPLLSGNLVWLFVLPFTKWVTLHKPVNLLEPLLLHL